MQTAEQFMLDFFRARTGDARKFFAVGCSWDGGGTADLTAEELIVSTSTSKVRTAVITRPAASFRALRYHLRPEGESWLIWNVETECPSCHGTAGNTDCESCRGIGWCGPEANFDPAALAPSPKPRARRNK